MKAAIDSALPGQMTNIDIYETGKLGVSHGVNLVTLQFASHSGSNTSAHADITFVQSLDITVLPVVTLRQPIVLTIGSIQEMGILKIDDSGAIVINRLNGALFPGAGADVGWGAISISYYSI